MVHYTKKKKTLPFFDTENLIFVLSLNQYIYIYIFILIQKVLSSVLMDGNTYLSNCKYFNLFRQT